MGDILCSGTIPGSKFFRVTPDRPKLAKMCHLDPSGPKMAIFGHFWGSRGRGNPLTHIECVPETLGGHPLSTSPTHRGSYEGLPGTPGTPQGQYRPFLKGQMENAQNHPKSPKNLPKPQIWWKTPNLTFLGVFGGFWVILGISRIFQDFDHFDLWKRPILALWGPRGTR
jgi:hypothetical protein